jgi:sterol desaturase/sphingolipid hydroxylase (fatty acid hydroxylase superfamily)
MSDFRWITTGAIVIGAMIIVLLERWRPYTKGQPLLRAQFFNDLIMYGIVQSYILALVISWMLEHIPYFTAISKLGLVSGWPLMAQLALFLVEHDLYIYWFHRWQHNSPVLWRIHEAHHATTEVDWLSGARSHSIEILINQGIEFGTLLLLGASPEVVVIKGAVDALWGMYIHSNFDPHMGKFQRVFNGPEMHRWHHAIDPEAHNRNFSTKLAIWDWLFGTAYLPYAKRPSGYGLGDEDFPTNYFSQHAYAFRRSNG